MSTADYNLRVLWPLGRYVEETRGREALEQVAVAGGVRAEEFGSKNLWVSAASFEAMLAAARGLLRDDEEFKRACRHRLKEGYGPLGYLLLATTPGAIFQMAAKHYDMVCGCGTMTVTFDHPTSARCIVTSRVPFSRLNCLVRQAQSVELPTLWGLPPAHLREGACMGRGDATCELSFHWYAGRRWVPIVLGAAIGALLGGMLVRYGVASVPSFVSLALLGGTLGWVLEGRRAERVNERTREAMIDALRDMAQEENEARRELLEMHARQKDWTRLVEEQMGTRAAALQRLAAGVSELQDARNTELLGFSHDLRNPLQIIKMSIEHLKSVEGVRADAEALESVHDVEQSVALMRRLLGDLVRLTQSPRDFVTMAPRRVETAELTAALSRRLRALLHGREVRGTVLATREAPDHVEVDPLALDRIVDNLLTNAAKYTERGSISVEVGGAPGHLVLQVADTGCGIEPELLEEIFELGGSTLRPRGGDSLGIGLSVVVQLLDQMGGRLEVTSRTFVGTTFWVYLPQKAAPPARPRLEGGAGGDGGAQPVVSAPTRVVTVRKRSA